ncbi:putative integral membrane protein [Polychaeton citri CBS 116435]|uniref:Integral membrane protein n=1 Tax=Polychaeton citri CBS 116435 TaxID=1314669 RepID=A0A9P4UMZ4_9PEZI|nr:putative integral membrane protein [Polychaeton citri CBS 116435]
MATWRRTLAVLLLQLLAVSQAVEMKINQKESDRQICSGMYSRKSWGGSVDPFILIKFIKPDNIEGDADPTVSLVVFEWKDRFQVGHQLDEDNPYDRTYICDDANLQAGYCNETDLGAFILAENAQEKKKSRLISEAISLKDPPAIQYPIKRTGYYCVGTFAYTGDDYTGIVEFRNAFGELPAAQIAKLPFYAVITIVYAFLAMAWGALYWLNRHDILAVQNYITAILVFLVVEMFMTWLFYDYQNRHGLNAGTKALLVVVSVLSAARNSFSFFLLLIVCMGYGVVKHSLGKTMVYVRWLAVTHFVFGVLYVVASLSVTPENAGPLVLLVVLPLAATLTAFYVWTLNSLGATMKDLAQRKQHVKAGMYRKLWWCILVSIVVIFVFFFVNSWTFAGQSDDDFVPNHWSTRWFILDGWLNLVYFADVAFVAYIWRPTANNRRFAMSDEIAQDDEGFEIASLRDSFDLEDPEDLPTPGSRPPDYAPPGYEAPGVVGASYNRDQSPLPAPVPTKPTPLPRESLDGETIFAVGEDVDKFSDDDDDSDDGRGEGSRLTRSKD